MLVWQEVQRHLHFFWFRWSNFFAKGLAKFWKNFGKVLEGF